MSTTSVSVVQTARSTSSPTRDPLAAHLLTIGVAGLLTLLLVRDLDQLLRSFTFDWPELAFWTALVMFLSFIPVSSHGLRLTMDLPILMAIAFLYPASVGATVAVIATVDTREVRRQISLSRAVFNRTQIALSVFLAGWAFHALAPGIDPWPRAIAATAVALSVEYVVNVALVLGYLTLLTGEVTRASISRFSVGRPVHFLATYLGIGVLALILAHLFVTVGAWSVVTLLVPILVARQMLVRGQRLQEMAEELQSRERLLEKLMDRAVDERRDERLRIVGDLHDDVLQTLTRMWFLVRILERKIPASLSNTRELRELAEGSEACLESLRKVIQDLKESPLGRGGLVPTLRLLVRDLQLDWQSRIRLDSPDLLELPPQSQVIAYQVAREALVNALKHAKAREIRITLKQEKQQVELTVEDDGIGFVLGSVDQGSHFGIGLMKERLRRVGGRLEIKSLAHQGTELSAILPIEPSIEAD